MNRKTFHTKRAALKKNALIEEDASAAIASAPVSTSVLDLDFTGRTTQWEMRGGAAAASTYQISQIDGKPTLSMKITEQSDKFLQKSTFIARNDLPTDAGYYQLHFRMKTALTAGFTYPLIFAQLTDRSHVMLASLDDGGLRRVTGKTPWTHYSLVYQVPEGVVAVYAWFKADLAKGDVSFQDVRVQGIADAAAKVLLSQNDGLVPHFSDKKLIYKDDFTSDDSQWKQEGDGKSWREAGKLYINCLTDGTNKTPGMTLWLKPEIAGDVYISYETMVLEPENWNNLNFFLMGSALDGSSASEADFSGDYGQYHNEAKTYIGTLTYRWSRMRKDPGFQVISEDFDTVGEVNQKYFFEISKRDNIIEWRINGRLVHRAEDADSYQSGQFAIRSAGTFSWVRNLRIYQYV